MREVKAIKDLGVNKGATGSHVIECDDGRVYVVKFADGSKTAINELVGHSLAATVGIPVPDAAFVDVGAVFVSGSRDLESRHIVPGMHHGVELVQNSVDLDGFVRRLASEGGGGLSNFSALAGGICHDNWILTPDRDRSDNHLIQEHDGIFTYIMVDFTHGFTGPRWDADSIEQGSYVRTLMPVHPLVADAISGPDPFESALWKIEGMKDSEIDDVIETVPRSWAMTDEERGCLLDFLKVRRGLLRSIIFSGRKTFPNWA